jgi:hypothetical protein
VANIIIDLAAQFTGANAFKKADTATDKLNKNVKNLGKTLGLAFSVGAVLAYGKAAVKAAAEDQAAQASLAQTLKNLGLETGNTAIAVNDFISRLENQTGILDDELRPAMDRLLRATGSVTESQKLLNLAIDISAGTGKDLTQVTQGLQKAYLGNVQGLGRLGVGLTKAELKTGNFADITEKLTKLFAGQGKRQADSYLATIKRLGVAANNAKEIIGQGLIDSVMILAGTTDVDTLQKKIVAFATSAADGFRKLAGFVKENLTLLKVTGAVLATMFVATNVVTGIAALVTAIGTLRKAYTALRATATATAIAGMFALNPLGAAAAALAMVGIIAGTLKAVDLLTDGYNAAAGAGSNIFPYLPGLPLALSQAKEAAKIAKADAEARKKAQEAAAKAAREAAALQRKSAADALKAAKLKLAVDKATLALGKGRDVFDLEKIQNAAAQKNAAEQLGKITSKDQLLQITNDLARLEVKKSILDLEEAIAKQDVAAITNATNKLNADLKVLGGLTNQKIKLTEIDDILKAILPKDLINIKNLDEAIAKLIAIGKTVVSPIVSPTGTATGTPTGTATAKTLTPAEIEALLILGRTVPIVPDSSGTIGYSGNAGNYPSSGFPGSAMGYGGSANTYNITVQAGIGDPNAIAEAIDQVLTDAVQRGTLRSLATA